jgi:hypothetical protein
VIVYFFDFDDDDDDNIRFSHKVANTTATDSQDSATPSPVTQK